MEELLELSAARSIIKAVERQLYAKHVIIHHVNHVFVNISLKLIMTKLSICHSIWTQEFIRNNCNRSWYSKEHKEHRSKILIDYEMSQLPDTMVAADNYKFLEQLEKRK